MHIQRVIENSTGFQNMSLLFKKYVLLVTISSKYRRKLIFSRGIYTSDKRSLDQYLPLVKIISAISKYLVIVVALLTRFYIGSSVILRYSRLSIAQMVSICFDMRSLDQYLPLDKIISSISKYLVIVAALLAPSLRLFE